MKQVQLLTAWNCRYQCLFFVSLHQLQSKVCHLSESDFVWLALADYSFSIFAGTIQNFYSGDMLIMLGDTNHAGCAWDSDVPNVRLFCYLPSVFCLPTWASVVEDVRGSSKLLPGLVHVPENNQSNDNALKHLTSPSHLDFSQDSFDKHLYCSDSDKFFKFQVEHYYKGLQTINARSSIYSSCQTAGVFSVNMGACAHWPNQASLKRAGMIDKCHNTFRDLRQRDDCPNKDNGASECVQGKRIKSETSSLSNTDTPPSKKSRESQNASALSIQPESSPVAQAHTLQLQLLAANDKIKLLEELLATKEEVIFHLKKGQRAE
jgi:hypothetical protein